jgi:hypothetical protein
MFQLRAPKVYGIHGGSGVDKVAGTSPYAYFAEPLTSMLRRWMELFIQERKGPSGVVLYPMFTPQEDQA